MSESVAHNKDDHRFELKVDDHTSFIDYRIEAGSDGAGPVYVFEHTEVPAALGGRGIGGRLAAGALDAVRAAGGRLRSECSFISAFVKKNHDTYGDLLAD